MIYIYLSVFVVSKDFLAQTGDPTATGTGGESVWSLLNTTDSPSAPRYFAPELVRRFKHTQKGTVSMAIAPSVDVGPNKTKGGCGSQFFVTLADGIDYLDGKHAVFGHVVEGLDTLDKLNDVFTDQEGRPFKDVRIRHVLVLGESNMIFVLTTLNERLPQMTHSQTRPVSSNHPRHPPDRQITPPVSQKMKTRSQLSREK